MVNFTNWRDITAQRSMAAWERINEKPVSVVIVRDKTTTLTAQTVRLEFGNQVAGESRGGIGTAAKQNLILFGVRHHPTIANTDIKRGDRFALDGVQYTVTAVIVTTGELQAQCEAIT